MKLNTTTRINKIVVGVVLLVLIIISPMMAISLLAILAYKNTMG